MRPQAILVCFRLHKAKEAMVTNAAAASLRQICIELFDKVVEEAKDPGRSHRSEMAPGVLWGHAPYDVRQRRMSACENAELRAKMDVSDPHELPGQLPPAARDAYIVFQVRLTLEPFAVAVLAVPVPEGEHACHRDRRAVRRTCACCATATRPATCRSPACPRRLAWS